MRGKGEKGRTSIRLVQFPNARAVAATHHEVNVEGQIGVVVGSNAGITQHPPCRVHHARVGSTPSRVTGVVTKGVGHGVRHGAHGMIVTGRELSVTNESHPCRVKGPHLVVVVSGL